MLALFDLAHTLGITVEYAPLATREGEYRDDLQRIRLREGMPDRLARWVLAHELGHAHYGHRPGTSSETRQEREADQWAARHLITIDDYRAAEQRRDGHAPSMAHDLGIVTRGIHAYQSMLERIGDTVYLKPCHGAGQYAARTHT
ncbi:ImmA/IrrE family metallo-endopeptidase [Leucobacter sp. HY1910]